MEQEMRVEVTEGHGEKDAEKTSHKNMFEELKDSDIPPQEKTIDRLNQEGFALILAGGDTSSQTLAYVSFHLLDNPEILKQLKQEFYDFWACITEGLRVNAIATSRSVRVAPHETLYFKDWVIEPGNS
ncbi:hypothetical protein OEA41_009607 [Lepraria neglecta]|uniref:Cytochrome P450 n=1 Tax=Lepraria neglecta TaxID=209136 RepID=A0AAD9Z2C0_9LECA|nr:hypothetical protein OEA41_009607 [Lepraria neglecta]